MYYPLSQIVSNLYTNGNEFVLINTKTPYVGYYWKVSSGKYFTGKTPSDTPVEELIPYSEEKSNNIGVAISDPNNTAYFNQADDNTVTYLNLKDTLSPSPSPKYSPTLPTQQDYQLGEFRRYFCKKTNENIYLEISKDTYDKLINKNKTIAYQYYFAFNIPWQLTGDEKEVYKVNRNIVELTMKQQKLPMFDLYLKKDYVKYYQKS